MSVPVPVKTMALIGAGIGDHTPPATIVNGWPPEIVTTTSVAATTAKYLRCLSVGMLPNVTALMLQPRKLVFMYSPYKSHHSLVFIYCRDCVNI